MNALDFGIVIALITFFLIQGNMSFIYYLVSSAGALIGYVIGVATAPFVTGSMSPDWKRGAVTLSLILGSTILCGAFGIFLAKRLHMKAVTSRYFKLDKMLAWPCKLVIAGIALIVLSQTLIYVPLLALQFEAQGSTLLMTTEKLTPVSPFQGVAKKIYPDQFKDLRLAYDPRPIGYDDITKLDDFQATAEQVAPSVVKISGKGCVSLGFGSGFVAAPGMVVTNAHVVSGASSVYISDRYGSYPATFLVIDNDYDIAVLYSKFLAAKPLDFAPATASAGDKGLIMGYPGGGNLRAIRGDVSDQTRKSAHNKLDGMSTLALNATLGPGSSGGPIVNAAGEVIGITDAGGGGETIAIRANIAKQLVQKAQNKFHSTKTSLCAVPPKFY